MHMDDSLNLMYIHDWVKLRSGHIKITLSICAKIEMIHKKYLIYVLERLQRDLRQIEEGAYKS